MWQLPVLLRIIVAHGIFPLIRKKLGPQLPPLAELIQLQFFCSFLLSATFFGISGKMTDNMKAMIAVGIVGAANSFAAYCQRRAEDKSISSTRLLLSQGDDLLAMGLGILFLGEAIYLHGTMLAGVCICVIAGVLFSIAHSTTQRDTIFRVIWWSAGYCVIWGIAKYCWRVFALEGLTIPAFLFSWYAGAALGGICITEFTRIKQRQKLGSVTAPNAAAAFILSVPIVVSMALGYWATTLAPIIVTFSIFQVTEMILPTLLERKEKVCGRGIAISGIALIGITLVAMSY